MVRHNPSNIYIFYFKTQLTHPIIVFESNYSVYEMLSVVNYLSLHRFADSEGLLQGEVLTPYLTKISK